MPSSRLLAAATWPSIRRAECVGRLLHRLSMHRVPRFFHHADARARCTLQGLSSLLLQEFTRQREVMVTVERGLLHALAFDFNVEVPYPLAWRFLDVLVGEIERLCTVPIANAHASSQIWPPMPAQPCRMHLLVAPRKQSNCINLLQII
jgi:hypothetical protein